MNYNNKTIILALAAATASAVKLRSMTIFDDMADAIVDAADDVGDWVVGAAEDVGEATEDAFNTILDFGNDIGLAVNEEVNVAIDEMDEAFLDIGNFANDLFLDPNMIPDLTYDIEKGIIDPTDELLEYLWTQPEAVIDDVGDAFVDAGNWIVDEADDVGDAFEDAGDWIVGEADVVGDAIVDAADVAGDAIMTSEAYALSELGIDVAAMSAEEIALVAAAILI